MKRAGRTSAGIRGALAVIVAAAVCLLSGFLGYVFWRTAFFPEHLKVLLLICDAMFILGIILLCRRYLQNARQPAAEEGEDVQ